MHDIYVKFMTWLAGEALANSDRLKTLIGGLLGAVLVKGLAGCAFCSTFITPDDATKLAMAIVGSALAMVASLTKRDVAAPGQTVAGAAVPAPVASTTAP